MAIYKINLMILSLLTLEIFIVQADRADNCINDIKEAFGEAVSAQDYMDNILHTQNKRSLNLSSREDHVLYFLYIRQKADLKMVETVLNFCNSYKEEQYKDACFLDLQGKNLFKNTSKEAAFQICYEIYDLTLIDEYSYFYDFFMMTFNSVRVKDRTESGEDWCLRKYRR